MGSIVIHASYREEGGRGASKDEGRKGGEGRGAEGGWEGKLNEKGEVWERAIHNKVKDIETA